MSVRNANVRMRMACVVAVCGLALAVSACRSKRGPEGEGGAGGEFGEETLGGGGGLAGRSAEGLEAARRMGLRTVYFDYDQSELRADAQTALRNNYDVLRRRSDVRVEIQGNCDERGSSEYNFALGERRAKSARDYLLQLGLAPGQLTTVSFGEENPAVQGSGESAGAQNRRADFAVVP